MAIQNKTSILLPSAYRGAQLIKALDLIYATVGLLPIEVCVSVVQDDLQSQNILRDAPIVYDVRTRAEYERGAVYAWNKLLALSSGSVVALWADDLVPRAGWLDCALNYLAIEGVALVGFNDLYSDGTEYAAHWLAPREWLVKHLGGVMYPPMYMSWWADREVTDRARALGCHVWAKDAIVEHRNYTFGVSEVDKTYKAAQSNYAVDEATYRARKALGFPNDYKAVI